MSQLVTNAEKYIFNLFSEQLDSSYVYHNLSHTQRVVEKVNEIVENTTGTKNHLEDLTIAAWFHDAGYIRGSENHEKESARIVEVFLKEEKISEEKIEKIKTLVLATRLSHKPTNNLESIMQDADCAHLASEDFTNHASLLRKEWELTQHKTYTDLEWIATNIAFFTTMHSFYTAYSLKNWSEIKEKNLVKLLKSQKKIKKELKKFKQKKTAINLKKRKSDVPERGVETMFRVALRNHITLSDIADTKANILLSVNAIIVSLALSNLIPKLDNASNSHLLIPTIIFVLFTVVSIVLSILATRPNVTEGEFTKEDVANKKVNLLFFGNFHQMSLQDYEWGMSEMMRDKEYLYGSLTKDLYFLGLVLNRKYKILRITYTVFMIGIIVSVIAFAISFLYQNVDATAIV